MNKTIKLSLAAAMVAGMVSNANAKVALEDAIKDVTLKGYVSYSMEEYTDKDGSDNEAQHDIDVRVQADWKINDNYSATVRVDEANDDDTDSVGTSYSLETTTHDVNGTDVIKTATLNEEDDEDKDSSPLKPEIDQVYITYKDGGLKVKAGLQKVIAPRLHDSINGDGFIVSNKLSDAMTIAGGYFYTTEKTNTDEVAGLALAGKAGAVKYSATYATILDSDENNNDGSAGDNGAKVIDLTVDAKMGAMNLHAAHTTRSDDKAGEEDQSLTKLVLSGKAGDVKYAVAYAMAGKDGANVAVDGDADASVNLVLDSVSTAAIADGNAIYAKIGTKLTSNVSASLEYVTADGEGTGDDVKDASEYMLSLTNKVTKKFKLYAKYNGWEINEFNGDKEDRTRLTLGAKYSF